MHLCMSSCLYTVSAISAFSGGFCIGGAGRGSVARVDAKARAGHGSRAASGFYTPSPRCAGRVFSHVFVHAYLLGVCIHVSRAYLSYI